MADESEKRFHVIMDKLFQASPQPKPKPSATTDSTSVSGAQLSRGKKRWHTSLPKRAVLDPTSRGSAVAELQNSSEGTRQAPLCRPWDRGDLLKRLATFKSMTWFAKPEVVNAVNCARRGWVNVDMDIIACESCGARLLFSTPTSWAQHQVEKAALVFSLKLNNGHKLLCPWVDNACDEKLARFPALSVADLVDNYKKRYSSLLQLVALPVISASAIEWMKSPELEHFLNASSPNKSADASITEYLGDECEAHLSVLYYQAQKLISLSGWEPRLLPYVVDSKDRKEQSKRDVNLLNPSQVVSNGRTQSITVYSSVPGENIEANEDPFDSGVPYDPSSVVLDCRLCGAIVGLWTFCTAPRPVEFVRLAGFSEVTNENGAAHQTDNANHRGAGASEIHVSANVNQVESHERTMGITATSTASSNGMLNLTIAGGPPPADQNFRPIISLPVVGQNLRARFSCSFESMDDDDQCFKILQQGEKENSLTNPSGQSFLRENVGLIQSKRHEDEDLMSLEGADINEIELPESSKTCSTMRSPLENTVYMTQSACSLDKSLKNAASSELVDSAAGDLYSSPAGINSIMTLAQVSTGNGDTPLNGSSLMDVAISDSLQQDSGTGVICSKQCNSQEDRGVLTPVQQLNKRSSSFLGKDLKQVSGAKTMEFDPIRQHRHFCPWITSSGNSAPGWKLTLNALQRQKEFFYPSSTNSPSSSLIEVDDPVGSVKRLFTPPSAKRKRLVHGSS